jgi:hypothetical protein
LTRRTKWGFGAGDLGGNLFFTIIGFYLLYFLTDVIHLSAALAGTVLMIGKIWDAVTDPVTGYISDRTLSRWGRRRPYMFIGAIIAFFGMGLMFTDPWLSRGEALGPVFVCIVMAAGGIGLSTRLNISISATSIRRFPAAGFSKAGGASTSSCFWIFSTDLPAEASAHDTRRRTSMPAYWLESRSALEIQSAASDMNQKKR